MLNPKNLVATNKDKKKRIYAIFQIASFGSSFLFMISVITLSFETIRLGHQYQSIGDWLSDVFALFGNTDANSLSALAQSFLYLAAALYLITIVVGLSSLYFENRTLFDQLFILFVFIPIFANIIAMFAQLSRKEILSSTKKKPNKDLVNEQTQIIKLAYGINVEQKKNIFQKFIPSSFFEKHNQNVNDLKVNNEDEQKIRIANIDDIFDNSDVVIDGKYSELKKRLEHNAIANNDFLSMYENGDEALLTLEDYEDMELKEQALNAVQSKVNQNISDTGVVRAHPLKDLPDSLEEMREIINKERSEREHLLLVRELEKKHISSIGDTSNIDNFGFETIFNKELIESDN